MATKNQIRALLRKKQKAGLLPPQSCPACKADLADPGVPQKMSSFRLLWSLAREVPVSKTEAVWQCPVCSHVWQKHRKPLDL